MCRGAALHSCSGTRRHVLKRAFCRCTSLLNSRSGTRPAGSEARAQTRQAAWFVPWASSPSLAESPRRGAGPCRREWARRVWSGRAEDGARNGDGSLSVPSDLRGGRQPRGAPSACFPVFPCARVWVVRGARGSPALRSGWAMMRGRAGHASAVRREGVDDIHHWTVFVVTLSAPAPSLLPRPAWLRLGDLCFWGGGRAHDASSSVLL